MRRAVDNPIRPRYSVRVFGAGILLIAGRWNSRIKVIAGGRCWMVVRVVLGALISGVAASGREDVDLGLIPKRGHQADLVNRIARRIQEGDGESGQLTVDAGEAFEGVDGLIVAHIWCDRTPSNRTTEDLIRPQDRAVTSSDNKAWVVVCFTRITDPDVD